MQQRPHAIERLPPLPELERLIQSLALLDAILCPDWEGRYYSFNAGWDPPGAERMGSMRDGCGDDWFLLLSPAGAFLKGFAHESPVARAGPPVEAMLAGLPTALATAAQEPAFSIEETTFCGWCLDGGIWQHAGVTLPPGTDPDGSTELLALLIDPRPIRYRDWATDYYEHDIPLDAIAAIYDHTPLDATLARALNPDCDLPLLEPDLAEIGYPLQSS